MGRLGEELPPGTLPHAQLGKGLLWALTLRRGGPRGLTRNKVTVIILI